MDKANSKVERQNRFLVKRKQKTFAELEKELEGGMATVSVDAPISISFSFLNQSSGVDVRKVDSNQNTATV